MVCLLARFHAIDSDSYSPSALDIRNFPKRRVPIDSEKSHAKAQRRKEFKAWVKAFLRAFVPLRDDLLYADFFGLCFIRGNPSAFIFSAFSCFSWLVPLSSSSRLLAIRADAHQLPAAWTAASILPGHRFRKIDAGHIGNRRQPGQHIREFP
jgi:hypothetical protein